MASEYDAEAAVSRIVCDCAAYEQTAGLVFRVLSEVRAAYEAGADYGWERERTRAEKAEARGDIWKARAEKVEDENERLLSGATTEWAREVGNLEQLHAVVEAALRLRDSGYDGPMMGDATVELYASLAALDTVTGECKRDHSFDASCTICFGPEPGEEASDGE